MSWISGCFLHYCVLNTGQDSRTSHPKLSLYKFCAAWTPIVICLIFLYCSYIFWLELYLFVLLITSYFHIYFLLRKTSIMFYFHWVGKGEKLTAMVLQPLYQLQFYLQKQDWFYFLSLFSGLEIYVHINYSYRVINDDSENAPPYWETWYAKKGFRRLIIILSILIATFVNFFNVESHIFFLTYLCEINTRTHKNNISSY